MRLAETGGTTEGVDIEVQNATAEEIAFVQVKSRAAQAVLDDYVQRFRARRDRYHRMVQSSLVEHLHVGKVGIDQPEAMLKDLFGWLASGMYA